MNRIKLVLVLIFSVNVFGCVVNLSHEGNRVRIVDNKEKYNCKFLSVVTGSGSWGVSSAHDAEGAMNEVRNEVASSGGNALKIISVSSTSITSTAVGEALKCDFSDRK